MSPEVVKILEYLFLEYHLLCLSTTETFAQDFFLTYPAFMSISELCEELRKTYHGKKPASKNTPSPFSAKREEMLKDEDPDKSRKRRLEEG